MAYKFPDKDSGDKLDFTVDWTLYLRRLNVDIAAFQWKIKKADGTFVNFDLGEVFEDDAVSASSDSSVGLINAGQFQDGNKLTIVLDKGINGQTYTLSCQITTDVAGATGAAVITDRDIVLRVRDR